MNIVETHKNKSTLEVTVYRNFNLRVRNMIESRLSTEINTLEIDLSRNKFIDSEAVIFLYKWQKSGNNLSLIHPPEIFFEIIKILELDEVWSPSIIQRN